VRVDLGGVGHGRQVAGIVLVGEVARVHIDRDAACEADARLQPEKRVARGAQRVGEIGEGASRQQSTADRAVGSAAGWSASFEGGDDQGAPIRRWRARPGDGGHAAQRRREGRMASRRRGRELRAASGRAEIMMVPDRGTSRRGIRRVMRADRRLPGRKVRPPGGCGERQGIGIDCEKREPDRPERSPSMIPAHRPLSAA